MIIIRRLFLCSMALFLGLALAVPVHSEIAQTRTFNDSPIEVKELETPPVLPAPEKQADEKSMEGDGEKQPPSETAAKEDIYQELLDEVEKETKTTPVQTQPPAVKELPQPATEPILQQGGFFAYARTATIRALSTGKVLRINAEPEKVLKKSEVVLEMDCLDLDAAIEEVRLRHDQAKIRRQRGILERQEDKITWDEFALLELDVEISLAKLNRLRKEKESCIVQMPFTGRVHKIHVVPKESVQSSDPLVDIVSNDPLHFIVEFPVSWIRRIKAGSEITVYVEALDQSSRVKIIDIDDEVDLALQTVAVTAQVMGTQPLLRSGMRGVVRLDSSIQKNDKK